MEVIGWFFFELFILGYVEDPDTGNSFRIPGGLKWAVYIEVSSSIIMSNIMYLVTYCMQYYCVHINICDDTF